jgi:hypothetical protein
MRGVRKPGWLVLLAVMPLGMATAAPPVVRQPPVITSKARTNSQAVAEELAGQYARYLDAFNRNDPRAFEALTSSDFLFRGRSTPPKGRSTAVQLFREISTLAERQIIMREVTVNGDKAVAIVTERGLLAGIEPRTALALRWRHVWVRSPEGWKLQQVKSIPEPTAP